MRKTCALGLGHDAIMSAILIGHKIYFVLKRNKSYNFDQELSLSYPGLGLLDRGAACRLIIRRI